MTGTCPPSAARDPRLREAHLDGGVAGHLAAHVDVQRRVREGHQERRHRVGRPQPHVDLSARKRAMLRRSAAGVEHPKHAILAYACTASRLARMLGPGYFCESDFYGGHLFSKSWLAMYSCYHVVARTEQCNLQLRLLHSSEDSSDKAAREKVPVQATGCRSGAPGGAHLLRPEPPDGQVRLEAGLVDGRRVKPERSAVRAVGAGVAQHLQPGWRHLRRHATVDQVGFGWTILTHETLAANSMLRVLLKARSHKGFG